jgi:hypothetical protein
VGTAHQNRTLRISGGRCPPYAKTDSSFSEKHHE